MLAVLVIIFGDRSLVTIGASQANRNCPDVRWNVVALGPDESLSSAYALYWAPCNGIVVVSLAMNRWLRRVWALGRIYEPDQLLAISNGAPADILCGLPPSCLREHCFEVE